MCSFEAPDKEQHGERGEGKPGAGPLGLLLWVLKVGLIFLSFFFCVCVFFLFVCFSFFFFFYFFSFLYFKF